jgi:hypothetical protein
MNGRLVGARRRPARQRALRALRFTRDKIAANSDSIRPSSLAQLWKLPPSILRLPRLKRWQRRLLISAHPAKWFMPPGESDLRLPWRGGRRRGEVAPDPAPPAAARVMAKQVCVTAGKSPGRSSGEWMPNWRFKFALKTGRVQVGDVAMTARGRAGVPADRRTHCAEFPQRLSGVATCEQVRSGRARPRPKLDTRKRRLDARTRKPRCHCGARNHRNRLHIWSR